ncbi:MAG: PD40 domain-containing protein [Chloroflexi bacterium]|nr:PD40 domain-containing protein [Chloroflexota bacterium]
MNLSNQSWGPWAQRTFRTRTTSSATISPVSPPDGGAVSTATPTLTWANSDSSIFLYEVQLSEDPTFTLAESACSFVYWNVIHGGITKPLNSFTVPASHPLSNRTNYWRVRPRIQGDGTPLPWSRTFSFTVTAPSAPGAATPTPTPIASAAAVPPAPLPAIAYVSVQNGNWEVYLMNPDGGGQVRLTNEPATDGDLTWSPDGTKLAFTSNRTGVYQIYTMNRDGTEVTPLTASTALNGDPVWSLGGGIIAFAACRDGNSEIYVMRNPHGTEQTRITRNTAFDGDPTQSPDGSRIAFVSQRDGIFEIYAMNADGSGLTRLTTSVPGVSNGDPSWSPDGTRIAFTSDRTGNWEIYTMRPGGSDVRQLTNNKAVDGDPAWSPDSQRIIFFSDRDGNKEIYVMNADGSGQTRLTFNTWDDFEPVWWGPELSAVVARMAPGGGGGGAPPSPPPSPLPPPPLPITGGAAPAAGQVAGPATALASASFAPGTGGALRSGDYSISVPAGVTGQAGVVAVQVAPITGEVPAPAAGTVLAGQAFELGLSVAGQWVPDQLQRPLQISFPLDPASLAAAGGLPQNFALAFLDEATGRWQILPTICSAQACTAEVHHLSTFALLVTIPTPTATYPGDATTVYYLGPRLAWQTEGNVTQYHVQLAPTGFDGPAIDLIVSDPAAGAAAYFDVPAPVMGSGPYIMLPGTTYAWRVRTSTFGGTLPADSPGWSRWSAARTFSTNQPVGWGISAVAPRTGGLADSATPTLRWTDQFAFYFFYELQMSQDPRFGPDSFLYWEQRHGGMTEPLNSYSVPPEFPLTPNTTYYWRVRPWVPPASPASGWSETFSLRTPG